jgi:hypothetical protein
MTNLTKQAKGKQCFIRVNGYCNFNPETTVACHARLIGISGMGMKAPDLFIAFGCSACHDVVDGRDHRANKEFTVEQRRLMLLEGVLRTQAWFILEGILKW